MSLDEISPAEIVVLRCALHDYKVKVKANKESITVSKFHSVELYNRFDEQLKTVNGLLEKIERC